MFVSRSFLMCITSSCYSCMHLMLVSQAHSGILPLHTWKLPFWLAGAVDASKIEYQRWIYFAYAYRSRVSPKANILEMYCVVLFLQHLQKRENKILGIHFQQNTSVIFSLMKFLFSNVLCVLASSAYGLSKYTNKTNSLAHHAHCI